MTDSLDAARLELQARLPKITKDETGQVGTRNYKYADLPALNEALLPVLTALCLLWTTRPCINADGRFVLAYRLVHVPTGEAEAGEYPIGEASPQAMGAAITYARRYALQAVTGIAPDDDDGTSAAQAEYVQQRHGPPRAKRAGGAHERIREQTLSGSRPAERHTGTLPGDQWTAPDPGAAAPEDQPGTSTPEQRQKIGMMFRQLGITDQPQRHAWARDKLHLPGPVSSTQLSYSQAQTLQAILGQELGRSS